MDTEIVICGSCRRPEYWGDMRWLNGWCMCRNCYRSDYEAIHRKPYLWDDLDGECPTMEDYTKQEAERI